jgi:hypothetical protein
MWLWLSLAFVGGVAVGVLGVFVVLSWASRGAGEPGDRAT